MKVYTFKHSLFTRNEEGYIMDFITNTYEIIATSSRDAHTKVPPSSLLTTISTMDGRILFDFTVPLDEGLCELQLRRKIGEFGRNGLSSEEYDSAVEKGLIR